MAAAVVLAVHRGWNVIDTASNYRQGRAEVDAIACLCLLGVPAHDYVNKKSKKSRAVTVRVTILTCHHRRGKLPKAYVAPGSKQGAQAARRAALTSRLSCSACLQVAVGQALTVLREVRAITGISGMTGREMVFISTKAGYVSPELTQALLERRQIGDSDVVGGMHCMHSACLAASLARSLRVMNLDTVRLQQHPHPVQQGASLRVGIWTCTPPQTLSRLQAPSMTQSSPSTHADFTWPAIADLQDAHPPAGALPSYHAARLTWACRLP